MKKLCSISIAEHVFYICNQKFIAIEYKDCFECMCSYSDSYYACVGFCDSMEECKLMARIFMGEECEL